MATLMDNLGIMERARQILSAAGRRTGKGQASNGPPIGASNAKLSDNTSRAALRPIWMETEARVTECRHELVRTSALTLHITNDPNKLIVSFTYYAHARTYYDNFVSTAAMVRGETFSVYYNALNPSENSQSPSETAERSALSDFALLGSIAVSILFLTMVRG
jgi:hypothetical protein